jgi:hypothetical protein
MTSLARPRDDSWDRWQKNELALPAPSDSRLSVFRDPTVFRD